MTKSSNNINDATTVIDTSQIVYLKFKMIIMPLFLYPPNPLLSGHECSFCEHNCCRSCGINIQCNCGCEEVACEDCRDALGSRLCPHLRKKFIIVKRYHRIMSEK